MIVNVGETERRGFDEAGDATRRTRLANERTYLAWWRTGLTAVAASAAIGKLVPEVAGGAAWPYEVVGAGFAIVGLLFIAYGLRRPPAVERAVARGEFAAMEARFALAVTALGVALALATLVLVVR